MLTINMYLCISQLYNTSNDIFYFDVRHFVYKVSFTVFMSQFLVEAIFCHGSACYLTDLWTHFHFSQCCVNRNVILSINIIN